MRGAIAFGLALQIQQPILHNDQTLKTTVQIIVLLSTVVLGSGMSEIAQRLEVGVGSSEDRDTDDSFSSKEDHDGWLTK